MKKQLFLSIVLLAISAETFTAIGRKSGGGSSSTVTPSQTPPAHHRTPASTPTSTPTKGGSESSAAAAKVAEDVTADQLVASIAEALNVDLTKITPSMAKPEAVNYVRTGKAS